MVQEQDTGLTPEEQEHINQATIRLMKMLDITPAPTELGNALRALADRVDNAPALWGAKAFPDQPARVSILMTNGTAVWAVGKDLAATVKARPSQGGELELYTTADVDMGYVELHLFAYDAEPRELHRPVDVTETIEEQEQ